MVTFAALNRVEAVLAKKIRAVVIRRLPGTLVFGLLAAMAAHAAVYGGGHEMGGAHGEELRSIAAIAASGIAAFWAGLCWSGRNAATDGTVLASRMAGVLPSWPAIAAAGTAWFFLIESLERDGHADAPMAVLLVALVVAALAAHAAGRAFLGVLSQVVFSPGAASVKARSPIFCDRIVRVSFAHLTVFGRAYVARPPPPSGRLA